jgi:hypothetical protein
MPYEVTNILRHITIKVDELLDYPPFYVTNFAKRKTERGRDTDENGEATEAFGYVVDILDTDETFLGTAFLCARGAMEDVERMAEIAGPDEVYGPVNLVKVGRAKRLASANARKAGGSAGTMETDAGIEAVTPEVDADTGEVLSAKVSGRK